MAAERWDWFSECYSGEHQRLLSPEAFRMQFCTLCRNVQCTNSVVNKSLWQARMDSQTERLLDHPTFGDPNDPAYEVLAGMVFDDRYREALALEISAEKGDWEPVTDIEVNTAMLGKPRGFQEEEQQDPPVLLWDGQAKGVGGVIYRLTLIRAGAQEVWSCTCPAFSYGRSGPQGCKHIQEARAVRSQTEAPAPPKPPTGTSPATRAKWEQAAERHLVPKARNTAFPSGGMMIDGSPPAPPPALSDPWAIPAPAAPVVPVGGKVTLGGKKEG